MRDFPIHGIGELAWDHASVPERIWKQLERMPNGCWHAPTARAIAFRDVIVERVTGLNPRTMWAVTPTCGSYRCVNPAHVCVTLATPLSEPEK